MKRLLAALILGLSLTAGIRPSNSPIRTQPIYRIWEIGDLHYSTALGSQWKGSMRLRKMIYLSNERNVDAWIVDGDWAINQDLSPTDTLLHLTTSAADTVHWLMNDSLKAEVFPIVGNHEWSAADTASGRIYNKYTNRWPDFFRPYVSDSNRGARWWGRRVGSSNVVIFALQNIRDTTGAAANYYENNNPTDQGALYSYDFDGISDSTSAQRVDLKNFVQGTVQPGDVVFIVQHRAVYRIVDITPLRQNQERVWTNANESQILWLDRNLRKPYILIEADTHQNMGFKLPHRKHYVFSACMQPRDDDAVARGKWASLIEWVANANICTSNAVLDDSLGATSNLQPALSWNTFIEFEIQGNKITARCWLVQYGSNSINPSAVVDSVVWYQ